MNSSKGYYTAQSLVTLTFTCMDWYLNFNTRFIKMSVIGTEKKLNYITNDTEWKTKHDIMQ